MELDLSFTSISHLPKSIGNLHNLRNLNIDGCDRLAQLPEDICNLSSLDRLEFDQNVIRRLPRGIGRLRNTERLGEFVVGKEGWGIEELNGMNKLKGSLTIPHLENVDSVEKALHASLKSKMGIDSLSFKWSSLAGRDDGEMVTKILDALEPCPKGLVTLSLENYHGKRVPMWMANLRLPSLEKLILDELPCVERVMDVDLPSLKLLRIENCPKLMVVSMAVPNLEDLHVSNCQGLTSLCMIPSLQGVTYASEIRSLQVFKIINCPGLVTFLDKGLLQHLPRGLGHNTSLMSLQIQDCPELVSFPEEGLPPMLQDLKIAFCTNRRHLTRGLGHNTSLTSLQILDCPELVSFPEEGLPPMLQDLKIESCTNLRHLPRGLGHNTSLTWLTIKDCPELVSFPEDGLPPMLQELEIASCTNLRHLPRGLGHNTSLTWLTIKDCPELVSFPEEGLPPMLQGLEIAHWKNLQHLLRDLRQSTSLTSLTIKDCPELVSFPEDGLPPMLQDLEIASCTNLLHLPRGLGNNTLLTSLTIESCPELVSFPEEGLNDQWPPDVQPRIFNCSKLEQQLKDQERWAYKEFL